MQEAEPTYYDHSQICKGTGDYRAKEAILEKRAKAICSVSIVSPEPNKDRLKPPTSSEAL